MARLKAERQWHRHQEDGAPLRNRLITATADMARLASRFPTLANSLTQSRWTQAMMERLLGFDRRVPIPRFAGKTFRHWFERYHPKKIHDRQVIYFVDTWTNHFTPQVGIALVKLLEALSYHVVVPSTVCCGRPAVSQGLLGEARRLAEQNVNLLSGTDGPILITEPSCLSLFIDEMPQLVRTSEARQIAERAMTADSFIAEILRATPDALSFDVDSRPVLYHGHCHQKALLGTEDAMHVLRAAASPATEINSGCCGMAGAFGHEREHYEIAKAVGEQRLFPAVRNRGDAEVIVPGFSCRHQIEHHVGVRSSHIIELLANRLRMRG